VKYSTQCAGDTNKLCLNLYTYGEKSVAILYLANTHIISITHMRKKHTSTMVDELWKDELKRTSQTNWFLWDIPRLVQPLHASINLCCREENEQILQGRPTVQVCVDLVIAQGNHCPSKAANLTYPYCRDYSPMMLG
jgi:hypothetical protein